MKILMMSILVVFAKTNFANEGLILLGERLFNDPRFSYPAYNKQGKTISCASCHMVDQKFDLKGMRIYNDHKVLSDIPFREDGKTHTLRNTPTLVGIGSAYAKNRFSHHDGEFSDHSMTVLGNFTGRNMGWLKDESHMALKNIVNVIKEDRVSAQIQKEFGGSYGLVMNSSNVSADFKIPKDLRLNINTSSDKKIRALVITAVNAYMNDLDFKKDKNGNYMGSSYDEFLKLNNISTGPGHKQSVEQYSAELMRNIIALKSPKFVKSFKLETHKRSFEFGEKEFLGMKVFFNLKNKYNAKGMCVACHRPPLFSVQNFKNIGVTQLEYEKIHGQGSFLTFKIPSLKERENTMFLSRASEDPSNVDLGVWNFIYRSNTKELSSFLKSDLCAYWDKTCTPEVVLNRSIARVKVPTLRNLNHSNPYFHNGVAKNLEDVMDHYEMVSFLARDNKLRNPDPTLKMIRLDKESKEALKAFMNSLNSDYD